MSFEGRLGVGHDLRKRTEQLWGDLEVKQFVCSRDHREFCVTRESVGRSLGRGEMEVLEAGEPSQGFWPPDGDPHSAWQALNKLGFIPGLVRDSVG